jgi:hypothetical protein
MSYITGGNVQAADYNTLATLSNSTNEVFADLHPGTTTIAAGANYGYGQTPALTSVVAGNNIQASEWSSLFSAMRACATHQGTGIVPPVPASGPNAGEDIVAINSPSTMAAALSSIRTNRMNLAGGQTNLIIGSGFSNPGSWSTLLVYTFQVDFGSWNNARYYFNTGSSISITGSYSPAPTDDELGWQELFNTNFPVNFNWETTTPTAGGNLIIPAPGFYADSAFGGLDDNWQSIYQKYVGGGGGFYYTTNYALIEAKLAAVAGTNGLIDFRISLIDDDPFPVLKPAGRMTYTINRIQSAGTTPYPGSYSFTSGGFVAV